MSQLLESGRRLVVDLYGPGQVGTAVRRALASGDVPVRQVHGRSGLVFNDAVAGRPVLVDCTSPDYHGPDGRAWVDRLESILESGTPVVTCNKAPLATAWDRLHAAARRGSTSIHATATVGGGSPIIPTVRRIARTLGVAHIEASLSGTLAFVVQRIGEGQCLTEAVADAQRAGYAEPDPRLDIDGTDAAAKAVILHNVCFDPALRLQPGPHVSLHLGPIRAIARAGGTPRAVASIRRGSTRLEVKDAPWAAGAAPGDAVVRVTADDGSVFRLSGPGAGTRVTAANIVADLLEIA